MPEPQDLERLLIALRFSAEKHRDQRRKDHAASPYINHPIEVATLLATIGQVTDMTTLIGAVLHDTIEDTETTADEIEELFGVEVREVVEEVTDDKLLPRWERKRQQVLTAPDASRRAKLIKLADKTANVRDVAHRPPAHWTLQKRRDYLEWTAHVVAGCRGVNEALERAYDAALRDCRDLLDRSGA